MAKDFYDKLKIFSEVLRNNWPLILMGVTALGSVSGNIAQYFGISEAEAELKQTQDQVANVAKHLTKHKHTEKPKATIINSCKRCEDMVNDLREEYH